MNLTKYIKEVGHCHDSAQNSETDSKKRKGGKKTHRLNIMFMAYVKVFIAIACKVHHLSDCTHGILVYGSD